jgi:hypothetical protein
MNFRFGKLNVKITSTGNARKSFTWRLEIQSPNPLLNYEDYQAIHKVGETR